MIISKYIYSQLSPHSVSELIIYYYDIHPIISCDFYVLGLHDNYLIKCCDQKYILRIYRNDWRTQEEIGFELELLSYLQSRNQSLAHPLLTKNNKLSFDIGSPEGKRIATLFSYAEGEALNENISIAQSKILGSSVANIHEASNNFKTANSRNTLDLEYLIGQSLVLIQPYIDVCAFKYLESVKEKVDQNISYMNADNTDFGICIGDVNQTNFHIDEKNKITLFDFDQCGYGYRAIELLSWVNTYLL